MRRGSTSPTGGSRRPACRRWVFVTEVFPGGEHRGVLGYESVVKQLHSVTDIQTPEPWSIIEGSSPIVAAALHEGHELRPDVEEMVGVPATDRRREEDPGTGWLTGIAPTRIIGHRSRFECDLNRPPDQAIALDPTDSWGLQIWKGRPRPEIVRGSQFLHAAFYTTLRDLFGRIEARHGRFAVLDMHAYNYRRGGPGTGPDDPATHPDVNVGTRSVDRKRWGHLVDRFMADLSAHPLGLDVRENVKFKGRYLAAWTQLTFPDSGCCLALEFKKTFMDEWTGEIDHDRLGRLADALSSTLPGIEEELSR